jgi:hypothetical protein
MKEMKGQVDSSDSQVSSSDSEKDELDEHNHKEGWSKKRTLIPKKNLNLRVLTKNRPKYLRKTKKLYKQIILIIYH